MLPFSEQFYVGDRVNVLAKLIEAYKYQSVRAASFVLANLLNEVIVGDYVLVPLPTIRRHIRERGFDHILKICSKMDRITERIIVRVNNSTQVGASVMKRKSQASSAYLAKECDLDKKYLLVDDVWTTGSSMLAACEAMRKVGAKNLAIAVIARSR